MAELLLAVRDTGVNDSGDILCAFNDRAIGFDHACHICHFDNAPYNRDGLRVPDCLTERFNKTIYQYTFQRVSMNEMLRINNHTGDTDKFGLESIDLVDYVRDHKRFMFGTEGQERWYGGQILMDTSRVNSIWDQIEEHSDNRRVNHRRWNLGRQEYKSYLALETYDYDDGFANMAISSLDIGPDLFTHKRMCYVPWRDIREITKYTESRIIDSSDSVDIRESDIYIPQDLIQIKGLKETRRGRHYKH